MIELKAFLFICSVVLFTKAFAANCEEGGADDSLIFLLLAIIPTFNLGYLSFG